jgi:hypothetical protein
MRAIVAMDARCATKWRGLLRTERRQCNPMASNDGASD